MPRIFLMSWDNRKRRWVKMHDGVRYRVSAEELNAPLHTKEASYRLANTWWERKLAEITMKPRAQQILESHSQEELDAIRQRGEAARHMQTLKDESPQLREMFYTPRLHDNIVRSVAAKLGDNAPQEMSVAHWANKYYQLRRATGIKPSTYLDLVHCLGTVIAECAAIKATKDVSTIEESTVEDVYLWLRRSNIAQTTQSRMWQFFKSFVSVLAERRLCDLPRNINSRLFKITVRAKRVKTFPTEQVREMLATLPKRLQLYALLGLNCGMLFIDIANLRRDEYQNGRIIRKRTKTGDHEEVPIVNYLLWPETIELLEAYPPTHPELQLTNRNGGQLIERRYNGDKVYVNQPIAHQWQTNRKTGKPTIQHRKLRSIAANLIEQHKYYGRLRPLFLGHAPQDMGERHYVDAATPVLDECLLWLRENFIN